PVRSRPARRRGLVLATLALVLALLAAACSDAHTQEEKVKAEAATDPRVVTVYEPAALAPALDALTKAYLNEHPGSSFGFVTSSPADQRAKINTGAKPDLWIDPSSNLSKFVEDPRSQGQPTQLGVDLLQFVVRAGNPSGITSLDVFGP